MKILVIDDDDDLRGIVAYALRQAGYLVVEGRDGREGLEVFERESAELVILDVNMPRLDGFEVCRRLRAASNVPILMLTVRDDESDLLQGLESGADDYLTKPFSPRALLARVRALLRRSAMSSPAGGLAAGELRLDPELRLIHVGDRNPVRLSELEFRLVQRLLAERGRPLHSDRLIAHVWGTRDEGNRQLLKQLVHRLRQKLEPEPGEPRYLVTVTGIGYALAAGDEGDIGAGS